MSSSVPRTCTEIVPSRCFSQCSTGKMKSTNPSSTSIAALGFLVSYLR
jgi:hypothetical protein